MKSIVTLSAAAVIALLAGCGDSGPGVKQADLNKNAPAPGSIQSPEQAMKDKLKSADSAAAGAAGAQGAKKGK